MNQKEAYEAYAKQIAKQGIEPKPYAALGQSYERHGFWFLRGYHCGTIAAVNTKTGEVE